MASIRRVPMTAGVILCLLITQWDGTLFASEEGSSSPGLVNGVAIAGQSVEPADVSSASGLQSGTGRLRFDALAENEALEPFAPRRKSALELAPPEFGFTGQIYQGPPYRYRRRHDGSIAAIMIGAAAVITGTAVLAYANRPECTASTAAGGCGYGTRVVGTAVLSGGVVGLFVGALTWR